MYPFNQSLTEAIQLIKYYCNINLSKQSSFLPSFSTSGVSCSFSTSINSKNKRLFTLDLLHYFMYMQRFVFLITLFLLRNVYIEKKNYIY